MSNIKEPSYFSYNYNKGEEWYLQIFHSDKFKYKINPFFNACNGENIIGEVSPSYFTSPHAPRRMAEFDKDLKLIFTFRNPIDRAISNFNRDKQVIGIEKEFEEIIKNDINGEYKERFYEPITDFRDYLYRKTSEYIERGKYYKHLCRYLEYFPKKQMQFIIFEDYIQNPQKELEKILDFLGVENKDFIFLKEKSFRNPSLIPISFKLQKFIFTYFYPNLNDSFFKASSKYFFRTVLNKLNHIKLDVFPCEQVNIEESTKNFLYKVYYPEIKNLEKLIKKDLSIWLHKDCDNYD